VAPAGAKSPGAPNPCQWAESNAPKYEEFPIYINGSAFDQGVCMSGRAMSQWLIGMERHTVTEEAKCMEGCLEEAGAKYAVYWSQAFPDGTNCGCYRECIPSEDPIEGASNFPTAYKLNVFLQTDPCPDKPKEVAPKLSAWHEVKKRAGEAREKQLRR